MYYNYLYAVFKLFNRCFDQSMLKFSFRRNLDMLYIAASKKERTLTLSTMSCVICIDSMLCFSTGKNLAEHCPIY